MKNEKEFIAKKEYAAPKMEVVELKRRTDLLLGSCEGRECTQGWGGEFQ